MWPRSEDIERMCQGIVVSQNVTQMQGLVDQLNHLAKGLQTCEKTGEVLNVRMVVETLRPCVAVSSDSWVRGAAMRALRFVCVDGAVVEILNAMRIHLFVIRSLEKDHKYVWERMQAIKLARRMLLVNPGSFPRCVIKSLISVANQKADKFRSVCLETLRELALVNTKAFAGCGGVRCLVNAIIDPLLENQSQGLIATVVHLLNHPGKRSFLRPSLDIMLILSPFTDTNAAASDPDQEKKWNASRRAIVALMQSWSGLLMLASDPHGLRALIQMLVQPVSVSLRKAILSTILEVLLNISPRKCTTSRLTGIGSQPTSTPKSSKRHARGTVSFETDTAPSSAAGTSSTEPFMASYWGVGPGSMGAQELASAGFQSDRILRVESTTHSLLDNFMSFVLLAFLHRGLVEALVELCVLAKDAGLAQMSCQMLAFVMRIVARYLPENTFREVVSFPALIESAIQASNPDSEVTRLQSQRAISVIRVLARSVGEGYDSAFATLLCRSACEDGVALASELALVASGQRSHLLHQGIFPRSGIVTMGNGIPGRIRADLGYYEDSSSSLISPSKSKRFGVGGLLKKALRNKKSSKQTELGVHHYSFGNSSTTVREHRMSSRVDLEFDPFEMTQTPSNVKPAPPKVSSNGICNRGHRQTVEQLVITDLAHTRVDEFQRLLNHSKVLLGKDFKAWDWTIIDEILSGPCQNHELCIEALKTKFIKRVAGFFRITNIGEFLALPWKPDYVYYSNVSTNLIRTLLDIPEGVFFLRNDRRGKIGVQLVAALDLELYINDDQAVLSNASTPGSPGLHPLHVSGGDSIAGSVGMGSPIQRHSLGASMMMPAIANLPSNGLPGAPSSSGTFHGASSSENGHSLNDSVAYNYRQNSPYDVETGRIFSRDACYNSMVHDFFQLLGVYTSHTAGLAIMNDLKLFDVLEKLSHRPDKDYINRLAVSNLSYTSSRECREWLQLVLMNKKISLELRMFTIGYLRGLLRSTYAQLADVARWVLELLFSGLKFGGEVADVSLSVLVEASHYPLYLDVMISLGLKPLEQFINRPVVHPLLMKYLGTEVGFQLLEGAGFVDGVLREWYKAKNLEYIFNVESMVGYELHRLANGSPATNSSAKSPGDRGISPAAAGAGQPHPSGQQYPHHQPRPVPIPVRAYESSASTHSDAGFQSSDLLSLFRLPWRIELWAVSAGGEQALVAVESFVDISKLRPESRVGSHGAAGSTSPHGVQISAKPCSLQRTTDGSEDPAQWIVPEDCTLYACLSLAGEPVDRNGKTNPVPTGGGGFVVPTRSSATTLSGQQEAPSAERLGSSPQPEARKRNKSAYIRHSLSRSAHHNRAASMESDDISRLWTTTDSILPLDDPLWVTVSPTQRNLAAVDGDGGLGRTYTNSFSMDDGSESESPQGGESVQFSLCPRDNCGATFEFVRIDAAQYGVDDGLSSAGSVSMASSLGVSGVSSSLTSAGASAISSSQQHNILNPLFSAAATSSPGGFADENLAGSAMNGSRGHHGKTGSYTVPAHQIALKSVSFHLELTPHCAAIPSIPVHVYGELGKTEMGRNKLMDTGHLKQFINRACETGIRVANRRAALWVLGHVGATEEGLKCLMKYDQRILERLTAVAFTDVCLTLRGTAVYALGLISRSAFGTQALVGLGWEPLSPQTQEHATVVTPRHPNEFFRVVPPAHPIDVWEVLDAPFEGDAFGNVTQEEGKDVRDEERNVAVRQEIVGAISDMSNSIAQKDAHHELKRLSREHPAEFESVSLFLEAHSLLAKYTYKAAIRRVVLEAFHRRIDFADVAVLQELDKVPLS